MTPIYLDYNATTPVDPRVTDAITAAMRDVWGNPSSAHAVGAAARTACDTARGQLARLIGAHPDEIVFTGGGSEASNLAIKGACLAPAPSGYFRRVLRPGTAPADCHVITTGIEHPATTQPVEFLRRLGASVTVVRVDRFGLPDPDAVRRAITRRTRLVTVMHSNNEVGTLLPIAEIGRVCRARGVLFHTDCAQSLGKVSVDVTDLNCDLLTVAGHKLYAPKGVGALYVRRGVALEPLVHGADHEGNRRAGTENVPYLVGLGVAADIARDALPTEGAKLRALRDRLHHLLTAKLGERVTLNGHPERRLPNTLNVNFAGRIGPKLLARIPDLAASVGAACHEPRPGAEVVTPSAVLCAMRVPPTISVGAVRLTVGRWTTEEEVDRAAELLAAAVG